jgi:hypothetical protein
MNNLVESTLAQCLPCLASTPCNNTEPLRMTKLPEKPWSHVSADFYGPTGFGIIAFAEIEVVISTI